MSARTATIITHSIAATTLALFAISITARHAAGAEPTVVGKAAGSKTPDDGKLKRLSPDSEVWLDEKYHRLVIRGEVVFREGPLELFACLKNTKEHEAIVACQAKAFVIHAGLLALGAEPGHPVVFRPAYKAATGPEIDVMIYWKDEQGKQQQAKAEQWIRSIKSGEALGQPWVFGGSGFWKDETSGEQHYMAESGDFICVSNFPSAMLDLPIESSQSNEALTFDCFTVRIPAVGTPLTLTLTPRLNKQPQK